MTHDQNQHLLVLTHGQEDGGSRATLAFALAVSLQAMGSDVAVYLHEQASLWAFEGASQSIHIPGFDSLQTYIDLFLEGAGTLYVCASCANDLPNKAGGYSLSTVSKLGALKPTVIPAGITTLASLLLNRKSVSL